MLTFNCKKKSQWMKSDIISNNVDIQSRFVLEIESLERVHRPNYKYLRLIINTNLNYSLQGKCDHIEYI